MKSTELRNKFINFFVAHGHKQIPSASLLPENDPSALFINSGMHPLVPYLMGEAHPLGSKLTSIQKCLRTNDIEEVGDRYHHTFFEMLGNWSLGAYFKKKAIQFSWEFLTQQLNLDPQKLSVTVFAGNNDAPRDLEAAQIWQGVGVPSKRIHFLEENWWSVGKVGPCGPDTEVFYDTNPDKKGCSLECKPGCDCGKFSEIWNNVFMVFNRQKDGTLKELPQKNVDTGLGLDRTLAVLNNLDDNYKTDLFLSIIKKIEEVSLKKYQPENKKQMRIIADHLRAAVFVISDEIKPSNKAQGYILRRLIRRAVRFGQLLGIEHAFSWDVAETVINKYQDEYPNLAEQKKKIKNILNKEEKSFSRVLKKGIKELDKEIEKLDKREVFSGKKAFMLYQSYGMPVEITREILKEKEIKFDEKGLKKAKEEHRKKSKKSAEKKFSGGLASRDPEVVKLHTTTHLLQQALKKVLGEKVKQTGSNITKERLRFDFTFSRKITDEELEKIEKLVNNKIQENLPVVKKTMGLKKALKLGAEAHFKQRYPEKVKVYFIGEPDKDNVFSKEICGGPHIDFTGQLGKFRIKKEESSGAGKRRIYAELH